MTTLALIVIFSILSGYWCCVIPTSNSTCDTSKFPQEFKFGAGSSAYQIEGAWNEDGKGRSFFDWYLNDPNRTYYINGNGNVADDSYHKYLEDLAAIKELGLDWYRFSIAWTRILPNGLGNEINQAGVDHYNNVIDTLLEAGVQPFVTIFHWDTPMSLFHFGQWESPDIVDYFVEYADLAFRLFGDRVKLWGTINEPEIFCIYFSEAYQETDFPELPLGIYEYKCGHHIILAHAKAYRLYETTYKPTQNGRLGIVVAPIPNLPATDSEEDVTAAERANIFNCRWIMDPLVFGDYNSLIKEVVASNSLRQNYTKSRLPEFTPEEQALIKGAFDVLMFNYYYPSLVSASSFNTSASFNNDVEVVSSVGADWQVTNIGFPVFNYGLRFLLEYLHETYNSEIIIVENGYSNTGGVDDPDRIEFIQDSLTNVRIAMCNGVNVTGYTYWSLLDSFEWNSGYLGKFGLVDVDFNNTDLPRVMKNSGYYYRNLISSRLINATTSS